MTRTKIPKECLFCNIRIGCPDYGDPCDYDTYERQLEIHGSEETKNELG